MIQVQILSKEVLHDQIVYSMFSAIRYKKNASAAFHWRIISAELFIAIYNTGNFAKDKNVPAPREVYHNINPV